MSKSIFETLNSINVNEHTEEKNGLTYLSWAWAWGEIKKAFPLSTYTIYESPQGWNFFTDGRTCWVKTGVTVVDGETRIEHIEYLPVMDYKNRSIPLEQVTSFDVNKAIQRSLTKACARQGLGLYIYANEDLPEAEAKEQKKIAEEKLKQEEEIKKTRMLPITKANVDALISKLIDKNVPEQTILKAYKVGKLEDLSQAQWLQAMSRLDKTEKKEGKDESKTSNGDTKGSKA